ncbi:MAG: TonB family protein [Hyphomicrobium sp.]
MDGAAAAAVVAPSHEGASAGLAAPAAAVATIGSTGADDASSVHAATLSAAVRILPPDVDRDRTFLIAVGLVLLIHAGFVAGTVYRPAPSAGDAARDQEQERRGQVEVSETITVELVEEPDGASKSKLSQIGADAPPAPQAEPQPEPPSPPVEAQDAPPVPKDQLQEQAKPQERAKPVERPKRTPPADAVPELSPDDFDTTMAVYAEAVERAQAERRRQADPRSAEAQRIKGAAAQGKQSAYSKSVTTALARNKPKGYLTRGGVYVQFELTMTGALRYVRVVQSSGDPLLDQTGVDAVKKTPFPAPPADVDPRDLRYTIHYVFN